MVKLKGYGFLVLLALLSVSCTRNEPLTMADSAILVVRQHSLFYWNSQATLSLSGSATLTYGIDKDHQMLIRVPVAAKDARRLLEQCAALQRVSGYDPPRHLTINWAWQGQSGTLYAACDRSAMAEYPVLAALAGEIRDVLCWEVADAVAHAAEADILYREERWEEARQAYFAATVTASNWNRRRLRLEGLRTWKTYMFRQPQYGDAYLLSDESPYEGAERLRQQWVDYSSHLFELNEKDGAYLITIHPPEVAKLSSAN